MVDDFLPEECALDDDPPEERQPVMAPKADRPRKDMPWRANADFREWHEQRKLRRIIETLEEPVDDDDELRLRRGSHR
jgi:hypothetical protein